MCSKFGYDFYDKRFSKNEMKIAREVAQTRRACAEKDKKQDQTIARALSKANSASYRSRKAGEAANEALSLAKSNSIKIFTTTMLFNEYGKPRVVMTFKTGIVLLGIETKSNEVVDGKTHYDFYDITGSNHMEKINNPNNIVNVNDNESITNIQSVYRCPIPSTILVNLVGKGKSNKPSKTVKLNISIQYIELNENILSFK